MVLSPDQMRGAMIDTIDSKRGLAGTAVSTGEDVEMRDGASALNTLARAESAQEDTGGFGLLPV